MLKYLIQTEVVVLISLDNFLQSIKAIYTWRKVIFTDKYQREKNHPCSWLVKPVLIFYYSFPSFSNVDNK